MFKNKKEKPEEKKAVETVETVESNEVLAETPEAVKDIEVNEEVNEPVNQEEEQPKSDYDLSVLKNANNVRVLIDYTNGRIGDDKVVEILDKINRK